MADAVKIGEHKVVFVHFGPLQKEVGGKFLYH